MLHSAVLLLNVLSSVTTAQVRLPSGGLTVAPASGGSVATLPGCALGWEEGLPDLPVFSSWVELGEGLRAVSVTVLSAEWEDAGLIDVRPLPAPAVPSLPILPSMPEPDPGIWSRVGPWPEVPVSLAGTGSRHGVPCAELVVRPLRWDPSTRRLERLVSLAVAVETAPARAGFRGIDDDAFRMLVVTDAAILAPMESLAAWRTAGGVLTEVVTTDETASWPGADPAERIRNYVIDRVEQDGFDYLLLGGDVDLVPCRYAFAMSYETGGGRDDSLPCDLYFSDLDGTWNLDGDEVWGEVADSVDLYPDIIVGRAPVEDLAEAWAFVDKTIAYEEADSSAYLDDVLLIGAVMWEDPYTDGGVLCDYLEDNFIYGFLDVWKQYESQGTYGPGDAIAALCMGTNVMDITAHGWYTLAGPLTIADVDAVNSSGRFCGMAASDGCWTSAFDFDAISEHFVTNPAGCGVSYIGNSSYGWGSPGNPLYGYSDRMTIENFRWTYDTPEATLGEIVALSKETFIPFSREANTYRCLQYMVNLLGDPSLRPYRMPPVTPSVEVPAFATPATVEVPVTVDAAGISVEGAVVCVHDQGFDICEVEVLDASGHAVVELPHAPAAGLAVTVTGTHLRRTTVGIPAGSGALAVLSGVQVLEPLGCGHLTPGSPASVLLSLRNQGTVPLTGVMATASLLEGPAVLSQDSASFGSMAPGQEVQSSDPLVLAVDGSAATGDIVRLDLTITSGQGQWSCELPLLVWGPGLYLCTCSVDDSAGGDGDGYAEPGESFLFAAGIANIGLLGAGEVQLSLGSWPSWMEWSVPSGTAPWIGPDSTGQVLLAGSLAPSAPSPSLEDLAYALSSQLWESSDTLTFIVGEMGLTEDVESGSPGWTHEGAGDLWHVTQAFSHSSAHSWHCGAEPGGYAPGMDCGLISPEFCMAPNGEVTFWSRFDLALYGGDGLYVVLHATGSGLRDTLDFIGAGGLLGTGRTPEGALSGSTAWLPRTYDISGLLEEGTTARLEFWFFSDGEDQGGGFWLDDILVEGCFLGPTGSGGEPVPGGISLGAPFPNPTSGALQVFASPAGTPWSLTVHDLAGRLVSRQDHADPFEGIVSIDLAGLPGGIYFVGLSSPAGRVSRSVLVL